MFEVVLLLIIPLLVVAWVPLYAADAVLEDLGPELTAYLEDAILETYPDS